MQALSQTSVHDPLGVKMCCVCARVRVGEISVFPFHLLYLASYPGLCGVLVHWPSGPFFAELAFLIILFD